MYSFEQNFPCYGGYGSNKNIMFLLSKIPFLRSCYRQSKIPFLKFALGKRAKICKLVLSISFCSDYMCGNTGKWSPGVQGLASSSYSHVITES
jgi:hypothetical protein